MRRKPDSGGTGPAAAPEHGRPLVQEHAVLSMHAHVVGRPAASWEDDSAIGTWSRRGDGQLRRVATILHAGDRFVPARSAAAQST